SASPLTTVRHSVAPQTLLIASSSHSQGSCSTRWLVTRLRLPAREEPRRRLHESVTVAVAVFPQSLVHRAPKTPRPRRTLSPSSRECRRLHESVPFSVAAVSVAIAAVSIK
ncbi:hypothetical protein S245_006432, partial [Arachis hypogaea]